MTFCAILLSKVSILFFVIIIALLGQVLIVGLLSYFIISAKLSRFLNQAKPGIEESLMAKEAVKYTEPTLPGSHWFGENAHLFQHRYLNSFDGLRLHAWFWPAPQSQKLAIICHGYSDYLGSISLYTQYFMQRDWNVLMIDQRSHGFSEGLYIGMSVSESRDLLAWTELMKEELPALESIVWAGWSMGGATVLQNADIKVDKVKAIIADSPFTTVKAATMIPFENPLQKAFMLFYLPLINLVIKKKTGVNLNRGKAIEHVKNSSYPILYFHGDQDTRVPLAMGEALFQATSSQKSIYIAIGSAHVRGFSEHKDMYEQAIDDFLADIL